MRRFAIALLLTVAAFAVRAQPLPPQSLPALALEQGWTAGEREIFSNGPVGSRLVPYAWFAALEQPGGGALFADPARLAAYGFMPGAANGANPGGLPVGLSRERDRMDGLWLGMSCAACHARLIVSGGQALRVDGAGSMLDSGAFLRDLVTALRETVADDARFGRFAARLEGDGAGLRARLSAVAADAAARLGGGDEGAGRADLLHSGAAARNPRLWPAGTLAQDVQQVLATGGTPGSVSLSDLRVMDALLRRLQPPAWPGLFPPIDPAQAAQGAAVFTQGCAGCHAGPGVMVAQDAVGTDGALARARMAGAASGIAAYRAGPLAGIWAGAPYLHNGSVPNLVELLTPPAARGPSFSLAPESYDPAAVGFPSGGTRAPLFDAGRPGDGNGGHAYGTELPEATKRALLEYLKTL